MTTTPFFAWTLGGPEIALIFVVLLLLFGAKKLPELARGMGKSLGEFKKARQEFEDEIRNSGDEINQAPKPRQSYQEPEPKDNGDQTQPAVAVSEPAGKQQYPG